MNKEDRKYLFSLITEALGDAKSKKKVSNDELDDFDLLGKKEKEDINNAMEDDFDLADTNEPMITPDLEANSYNKGKDRANVIKGNSHTHVQKKANGEGFDTKTADALFMKNYINKHNHVKKDILTPTCFGRIQVAVSTPNPKYKIPAFVVTLLNIDREDCNELYHKYDNFNCIDHVTIATSRENYTKDGISFVIPVDNIEKWKKEVMEELLDDIGRFYTLPDYTSKYYPNPEFKNNLRLYLLNRIVTKDDLTRYFVEANMNNIELFNKFIEAENDEDIQNFIRIYQRFDLVKAICRDLNLPILFGHILSIKNAQLVLGSGRKTGTGADPTFILTETAWRRFGRVVIPKAVPFPIFVPKRQFDYRKSKMPDFTSVAAYTHPDVDGQVMDITNSKDVQKVLFLGKKWRDLSEQERIAAQVMCNFINPSKCYIVNEYDISDTVCQDPNKDIFTQERGLVNNLRGELNAAAIKYCKENNIGEFKNDSPEISDTDKFVDANKINMEMKTSYALKYIKEYTDENGIAFEEKRDDESYSLIRAMQAIAPKFITHQKPANVAKLTDNAVYTVCMINQIALDALGLLKNREKMRDTVVYAQYMRALIALTSILNGSWKNYRKSDNTEKPLNEEIEGENIFKRFTVQELIKLGREYMEDMPEPQSFNNQLAENFAKYCGINLFD